MAIRVPEEWRRIGRRLLESGTGSLYAVGGTDLGKSTFCRYLAEELAGRGTVAILDCDTGQSTVGPPATIGAAFIPSGTTRLRFVGSTSPRGHVPQFLSGTKRLMEEAEAAGAVWILIDSPGYVSGSAGQEFHVQMIDLLRPDHLACFQRNHELEAILANFSRRPGLAVHRLGIAPGARARSRIERAAYRERRFREYFSGAVLQEVALEGYGVHGDLPPSFRPEAWAGRLVAFCDAGHEILSLGIVERIDVARLILLCLAPPFEPARLASIHVGSLTLDL